MTTKNPGKVQEPPPGVTPSHQDMQTAYQVHTLVQMLYGQLAMNPWVGQAYSPNPYEPMMASPMSPQAASWPMTWGAGPINPLYGTIPYTMPFHGFPH